MIQAGKQYVDGTSARKLEYDIYENNKVLKAKKVQKYNNIAKIKAVFCIMMIFTVCSLVMYRYSLITELNYDLNKEKTAYEQVKEENAKLQAQIERQTDFSTVMQSAQSRLGMRKPENHQIVYITVPRNDFNIASEAYSEAQTNVLAAIIDKITSFTGLLY